MMKPNIRRVMPLIGASALLAQLIMSSGCQCTKTIRTIDASNAARITVMGLVRSPGEYPIVTEATTLTQALNMAGGIEATPVPIVNFIASGSHGGTATTQPSSPPLGDDEPIGAPGIGADPEARLIHDPDESIVLTSFSAIDESGSGEQTLSQEPAPANPGEATVAGDEARVASLTNASATLLVGIRREASDDIYYFPENMVAASPDLIGRIRLYHGDSVSIVPWTKTGLNREFLRMANNLTGQGYTVGGFVQSATAYKDVDGKTLETATDQALKDASVVMLTRQTNDRVLREHFVHSLRVDDGLAKAWGSENIVVLDHLEYTTLSRIPIIMSHLISPLVSSKQPQLQAGPNEVTLQRFEREHCASINPEPVYHALLWPYRMTQGAVGHIHSIIHGNQQVQQNMVPLPHEAFELDPGLQDLDFSAPNHNEQKMNRLMDSLGHDTLYQDPYHR